MKRKQFFSGIGAFVGMLILIIDGKTALEGAQSGIELCLKTVIPSLFPFFLLSILLTSSLSGSSLPILRPLRQLCHTPEGAESILISGFLGGYPVGAQTISTAYHAGQLPKQDAERMLAFCNNAGPAFLFGMVGSMFPRKWMVWALWGIHIASAVLVSVLFPASPAPIQPLSGTETSLQKALQSSVRVIATVCGWVVIFRVLISFLKRWILWLLPTTIQVLLTGMLELSNGCCELLCITDVPTRFLVASGILALGGLCVTMQTISVTNGLSLRCYFQGKVLQALFSFLLSAAFVYPKFLPCSVIMLFLPFLLRKKQKKSSFQQALVV